MERDWIKIAVVFVLIILVFVAVFKYYKYVKLEKLVKEKNAYCSYLSEQLNANVTENSTCISYYCYYKPYKLEIPAELECICECKTRNGTILKLAVAVPK